VFGTRRCVSHRQTNARNFGLPIVPADTVSV
jgi:hypothetical protein